jgi:probable F420-dependent oxidoreductase
VRRCVVGGRELPFAQLQVQFGISQTRLAIQLSAGIVGHGVLRRQPRFARELAKFSADVLGHFAGVVQVGDVTLHHLDGRAGGVPCPSLPTVRPFRFGVSGGRPTRVEWLDLARKAEDLGYSSLLLPDHFGRQMAPLPALLAAAMHAPGLRIGTIVLDNDFRHPALLAKEAATIDLLTEGRLELGIGAGWMAADYRASGLPFDAPRVRVERLMEAVHILKAFFQAEGPITFRGRFYQIDNLEPSPRRKPRLLIAGTRRRMLRLAAREADIVGLEDHQFAERATGEGLIHVADSAEQVAIVREAAGARFDDLELTVFAARTDVTDNRAGAVAHLSDQLNLAPEQIDASTSFLLGSVEAIVDQLQERRQRLGISYIMIHDRVMDAFAPVVARLAGR